jgi:methylated-DNA-[protein]-cysteine S-methyltransferase
LTGYSGGIDKKIKLLDLEGADMSKLFKPKKGTAL